MALTLNDFVGFETGGLEEASATSGSPAVASDTVRTGSYALDRGGGSVDFDPFAHVADATDDLILGFAFYIGTLGAGDEAVRAIDTSAARIWNLQTVGTSPYNLAIDDSVSTRTTGSTNLTANTWYYIEIIWQRSGTGALTVFLDGSSEITVASGDFDTGTAFDLYRFRQETSGEMTDDIYMMSDATGTSDFLGARTEVLGAYQNTAEDNTDQGDALTGGTWGGVGELPFAEGSVSNYVSSPAIGGYTICDEGNRAGPANDAPGTIHGAKYIARLRRTNGSSPTTLDQSYGNSGDGVTHTDRASALGVSLANFFIVSEAATVVPTNSENFAHGMRQTGSGGRDIEASEFAAMLLHTQPALSTTLADLNFPDQNYHLGPFST